MVDFITVHPSIYLFDFFNRYVNVFSFLFDHCNTSTLRKCNDFLVFRSVFVVDLIKLFQDLKNMIINVVNFVFVVRVTHLVV